MGTQNFLENVTNIVYDMIHSDSDEDRPHMPFLQMHSHDEYRRLDDSSQEQHNIECEELHSQLQLSIAVAVPIEDQLQDIAPQRYN